MHACLLFSFIGFATQEVPIDGRATINVELREDTETLEEVVKGCASKKGNLAGAVSAVGQRCWWHHAPFRISSRRFRECRLA